MIRQIVFSLSILLFCVLGAACNQAGPENITGVWLFDEQKTLDNISNQKLKKNVVDDSRELSRIVFHRRNDEATLEINMHLKKIKVPGTSNISPIRSSEFKGKAFTINAEFGGTIELELFDKNTLVKRDGGIANIGDSLGRFDLFFKKISDDPAQWNKDKGYPFYEWKESK